MHSFTALALEKNARKSGVHGKKTMTKSVSEKSLHEELNLREEKTRPTLRGHHKNFYHSLRIISIMAFGTVSIRHTPEQKAQTQLVRWKCC